MKVEESTRVELAGKDKRQLFGKDHVLAFPYTVVYEGEMSLVFQAMTFLNKKSNAMYSATHWLNI